MSELSFSRSGYCNELCGLLRMLPMLLGARRMRLLAWVLLCVGTVPGWMMSETRAAALSASTIQWRFSAVGLASYGIQGIFETEGEASDLLGTGIARFPVGRLLELDLIDNGTGTIYRTGVDWSLSRPLVEDSGDIVNLWKLGEILFDRDSRQVLGDSFALWQNSDSLNPDAGYSNFMLRVEPSGILFAELRNHPDFIQLQGQGISSTIGGNYPIGKGSITPVVIPEPSEYGVMVGLGVLGWVVFRRRGGRAEVSASSG